MLSVPPTTGCAEAGATGGRMLASPMALAGLVVAVEPLPPPPDGLLLPPELQEARAKAAPARTVRIAAALLLRIALLPQLRTMSDLAPRGEALRRAAGPR